MGRYPRRVDDDQIGPQDICEPVLADEKDQGGRRADDRLRANTGALALDLALQTDQRGESEGGEKLDDLTRALSRAAEERRIGQPELHANKLTTDDFRYAAKSLYPRPIR